MVARFERPSTARKVARVRRVPARTPWGNLVGYSRAVRKGSVIAVSGTTGANARGRIIGRNDPYKRTTFIVKKIQAALKELGGSLDDIVRTRIYTTDFSMARDSQGTQTVSGKAETCLQDGASFETHRP